ncbi:MAG: peptidoglycan DD-metalloendopeptidase family protein [Candidatus Latescibacterota bacterium]|nr:peptidoglycan DD-metalloendopeptidase family protein [Candidatus Latescibacterota bacterium]
MEKRTRLICLWLSLIGLTLWVVLRIEDLKTQETLWNRSQSVNFVGLMAPEEPNKHLITPDANQIFSGSNTYSKENNLSREPSHITSLWMDYGPNTILFTNLKPTVPSDKKQFPFDWLDSGPQTPAQFRPDLSSIFDTLRAGDSIYSSLKTHGISDASIHRLNEALKEVFNAQHARAKDTYMLLTDSNYRIFSFDYTPRKSPEITLKVTRLENKFIAQKHQKDIQTVSQLIQVSIKDNLTNALKKVGEYDALTDQLTDNIFGSVIDFSRNPREGDQITVLVEKKYLDNSFLRYGRILMAHYEGKLVQQQAFYYQPTGTQAGYFDGQGRSLARQFLLYPLPFRGINSHFNLRRFHPILKRKVPHLGTDYAASIGTSVYATALGTITHAGRKGGYGLLVEIKHANGYRTRYAHLSKILVKNGQHVSQQQTIGKVGTTGRSTGPHLHYEIIKNGTHINPTTVNRGQRGKSLAKQHFPKFYKHLDSLQNTIGNRYILSVRP